MNENQIHVVFGTGPLGMAVIEELVKAGKMVQAVSRSGKADLPAGVELIAADASDPAQAAAASQGALVVYHCANVAYEKWTTLFPLLTHGILAGAKAAGARLVYGDNLYAYGPGVEILREDSPRSPVGGKPTMRAEMEFLLLDAHRNGELNVAIAKGSDFYGPRVLQSQMGDRVFSNLIKGKAASVIGDPDQPHTFTYIRDFARVLVLLGEKPEAAGQVWHVPSAETLTTREFIELAAKISGKPAKVSAMPKGMMNVLSLFVPILKELKEVVYQMEQPFIVDGSKVKETFGFTPTPLDEAIRETVEWYEG
ncbi:MAG TPA: NAD-dependent epimerase/dehydratase family protein [Anaerolineales bacterium]|nr:NAD-dependent epimerase/dehydratase family protein [Anaerolineales bacterium]